MACSVCGAPAESTCGECKDVHYCSRECQKADWRGHKKVCATFKRLGELERRFQMQENRLDAVAARLKYVENPCFCCGLQRAIITDVMLNCCGLVIHGMCLAEERASGECPQCGDQLPSAPEVLYEKASKLTTRNKYRLQKGHTLVPDDVCEVFNLHLEAAKQGHVQAQLRVYEAHWMGMIVARNVDIAIYFLALAAAHQPVTMASANAKVILGDYYYERKEDAAAQKTYYGAMQFYVDTGLKNKAVLATCAKICSRMGEITRRKGDSRKALIYFEQAALNDPGNAGYHHDLAVQYTIEGNLEEAEHEHRACLQLNPKHALAQFAVGVLLGKKGDKKAAAYFTRAQQLGHLGAQKQLNKLQIK
jgi:TPR repeat protein